MAIQIKRGTTSQIKESTAKLLPGQLLIDLETKELYAGTAGEIVIKDEEPVTTSNLRNGSGKYAVQQNYRDGSTDYSAVASGLNSVAFNGKRYDKLSDDTRSATSAEGNQSFAAGGSVHAHGDWTTAIGKDTAAYQKCSFVAGGGNVAGDPEGNPDAYSFAVAFGENNKATGRSSFAAGANNKVSGVYSVAVGDNNTVESASSFAVGDDNISKGTGNTLLGQGNVATGTYGTVTGRQNKISGESNFVAGKKNIVSSIYEGTAFGYGHNVSADYSLAAGFGNTVTHSVAAVFGLGNSSSGDDQTVIGRYNAANSAAAFIIGNGYTNYKQNSFEVLWDGRARVYGTPHSDLDVIRFSDIYSKFNISSSTVTLTIHIGVYQNESDKKMYLKAVASDSLHNIYDCSLLPEATFKQPVEEGEHFSGTVEVHAVKQSLSSNSFSSKFSLRAYMSGDILTGWSVDNFGVDLHNASITEFEIRVDKGCYYRLLDAVYYVGETVSDVPNYDFESVSSSKGDATFTIKDVDSKYFYNIIAPNIPANL